MSAKVLLNAFKVKRQYMWNNNFACAIYKTVFCNAVLVNTMEETIRDRVEKVLEELRPRLQADGGDIELFEVDRGVVKVRLKGACAGCPMSTMTLKMGVEQYLKKKIPEIVRVEAF